MSRRYKRSIRFDAYSDMRNAERDDRARSRITLAVSAGSVVGKPAYPHALPARRRKALVDYMIDGMRDWRQTPFEYEGPAVAGLRSQLCLDGNPWHSSDRDAREIVAESFRLMGAERPSWDDGQPEVTISDGHCIWCQGPIAEEDMSGHRAGGARFCSPDCATAMRVNREGQWSVDSSFAARAAALTLKRETFPKFDCEQCGKAFRPFTMSSGKTPRFCSSECDGIARRRLKPRACKQCGKSYQPYRDKMDFCSIPCQAASRRTLKDLECPNCSTVFRQRLAIQRFCSPRCVNEDRARQEPSIPKVCQFCATPFMAKSEEKTFCGNACVKRAMRFEAGSTRALSPPVLDFMLHRQGIRITDARVTDALFEAA